MVTAPSFFRSVEEPTPPPAGIPGIVAEDYLLLGHSREDDLICLHLKSGELHLVEPEGRMEVSLVNSSLALFLQCTALVREARPFRGVSYDSVADALEARLEALDPAALESDGFWSCFLSDLANGDYSA